MRNLGSRASLWVLLSGSVAVHAGTVTFNFDTDVLGKATPFTDIVSGLSATFTSTGDPGGFTVGTTFLQSLTGRILFDPGPAGLNNIPLAIQFSSPQNSIAMNFATNSAAGVPLTLTAFNGATQIGTSSAIGIVPPGGFPEGLLTFSSGTAFNRVVLSSTALDFAIDNVTVSDVPEPGSVGLIAAGWVLFALGRRVLHRG